MSRKREIARIASEIEDMKAELQRVSSGTLLELATRKFKLRTKMEKGVKVYTKTTTESLDWGEVLSEVELRLSVKDPSKIEIFVYAESLEDSMMGAEQEYLTNVSVKNLNELGREIDSAINSTLRNLHLSL